MSKIRVIPWMINEITDIESKENQLWMIKFESAIKLIGYYKEPLTKNKDQEHFLL